VVFYLTEADRFSGSLTEGFWKHVPQMLRCVTERPLFGAGALGS